MKNTQLKKGFVNIIVALAIGAIAVIAGAFLQKETHQATISQIAKPISLGAINYPTGGGTYKLASSISSTQTSIKLSSFKEPTSGINYTMSYLNASLEYATIDPQTTNSEFISFSGITQNADGTATLTGVLRGLSRSYPYTASSTFQQTHSGQANLILSNPPQLYNDIYTYINSAIVSGAVDASPTIKGIVEEATAAEAASHAADGSGNTTAPLALTSSNASSTRAANIRQIVVASTTGYIDDSFIATSTAQGTKLFNNVAFTGNSSFATSTAFTTGIRLVEIGKNYQVFTNSGTFTVPSGITRILIQAVGGGGAGGAGAQTGSNCASGGGGGAGGYSFSSADVSATTSIGVTVGAAGATSYVSNYAIAGLGGAGTAGSGTAAGAGGGGGGGTLGTINSTGGSGGGGMGGGTSAFCIGSTGGGSIFGSGGQAGRGAGSSADGGAGVAYGSGGGGGGSQTASGSGAGGAGQAGIVIISW